MLSGREDTIQSYLTHTACFPHTHDRMASVSVHTKTGPTTFNAGESGDEMILGVGTLQANTVSPTASPSWNGSSEEQFQPGDDACRPDPTRGEEEMVQVLKEVPAEKRWDIATRCSDMMPFVYSQAFRKIAPERQEELNMAEKEIWREFGKRQGDIAKRFGYPVNSAMEVAKAFNEISRIVLGPQLQGRTIQEKGDAATIITEQCPMAANTERFGQEGRHTCELCSAYGKAAIESLNPGYHIRSEKHMCMGDSSCRMSLERTQR